MHTRIHTYTVVTNAQFPDALGIHIYRHIQTYISTYTVVTNAQFPDAIRALVPVTQLYVSIDAATKATLKEIDRCLCMYVFMHVCMYTLV